MMMSSLQLNRRTEPVYRSLLPIGNPQADPTIVVDDVYDALLDWVDAKARDFTGRAFKKLGGNWLDDASFSVNEENFQATIVQDQPDEHRYALHVETGDREDARRRWIINAAVFIEGGRAFLDLQTFCNVPSTTERIPRSVPAVLRTILDKHPIIDGIGLTADPWLISTRESCAALVALLCDTGRRLPVVVASAPYLLDMEYLGRRLLGVAHIVKISEDATFFLTDALSKQWSVYYGAVRTYRTPFLPEHDERRAHPLALPIGIMNYNDGGIVGPAAFTPTFIDRAFRNVIASASAFPRHDTLTLRREILDRRQPAVTVATLAVPISPPEVEEVGPTTIPASPADMPGALSELVMSQDVALMRSELERANMQIADLQQTVNELEQKVESGENDFFEALGEAQQYKEQLALLQTSAGESSTLPDLGPVPDALRTLIQGLQGLMHSAYGSVSDVAAITRELEDVKRDRNNLSARLALLEDRTAQPNEQSQRVPLDLKPATVEQWAVQYAGKLVLHKRALQALADGQYEDPHSVYSALALLAVEYRNMRLRSADESAQTDEYRAFHEKLESLGLRFSRSISENELTKYYRHYHVPYKGQDVFLELHLRNGGATADPRRCLRIYFFFDREEELVVVGSLPAHLPNSKS